MTSSSPRLAKRHGIDIVLIGGSAGGPRVLPHVLAQLPAECAVPVVIVQHMAPAFADHFCDWLATSTVLPLEEARPGVELMPGTVYMILRGRSLELKARRAPRLIAVGEAGHGPSVDALFFSAARVYGRHAVAVLLSGMGEDGARGLKAIADAGGRTIVQDEETSMIYGMPGAATRLTEAHEVLSKDAIGLALAAAAHGKPRPPWTP